MPSVLLCDDSASYRALMTVLLRRSGIDVVAEAVDGVEVVGIAAASAPDAIVLDHQMPGRTGLEALPELLEAVPGVPVHVLTSIDDPDIREAAAVGGAAGFWRKDRDEQALADALLRV